MKTKLVHVLYLGEYLHSEIVEMKYGHLCALFVFGLVGTQLSKAACMLNFESLWSRMWWSKRSNAFRKTAKKNVIAQPLSKFYA